MLTNRTDPGAQRKLRLEVKRDVSLTPVVEWLLHSPEPLTLDVDRAGIEISPAGAEETSHRRSRLKLFRAREGKERFCAFFYKRSNLPWSRDRFSYGGVEFVPSHVTQAEVQRWIGWLASGLDPEKKPERLRRSFLYDIPD